jgi:hypothetical protein
MSDLPLKIDELYQKGLISKDEWRRLVDCLLIVDGISLELEDTSSGDLRESVDEALTVLIDKIQSLSKFKKAQLTADNTIQGYQKLAWDMGHS